VDWPEEWELLFVDEATIRRHPTLTAQWCLGDDGPEVPSGEFDNDTRDQAGMPARNRALLPAHNHFTV
jgi:hypothetical protein